METSRLKYRIKDTKAIFFDVNGTLRTREHHEPTELSACRRILDILGRKDVPPVFWEELERRYKAYGVWAQTRLTQLSEREIWTQWILPDEPEERIAAHAEELMVAWSELRGRRIPLPGTEDTLKELKKRGYVLGVISNTMSTRDIPNFIRRNGWEGYFQVVLLSAFEKSRKPAPGLFFKAAERNMLKPNQCAYVGNKFSKDIIGCKKAGYALGIMLGSKEELPAEASDDRIEPDLIINSLTDLLEVFPPREETGV